MAEESRRLLKNNNDSDKTSYYLPAVQASTSIAPDNSLDGTREVLNFEKALKRAGGMGNFTILNNLMLRFLPILNDLRNVSLLCLQWLHILCFNLLGTVARFQMPDPPKRPIGRVQ